jgi:hypothetical protein
MILIDLGITCSDADVNSIVDAFRAAALLDERLHVEVSEETLAGVADMLWGYIIDPADPRDRERAIEDSSDGVAEIKTFRDAEFDVEFEALVCQQPYAGRVEEALSKTGMPFFDYESVFTSIRVSFDQDRAPLTLHFDRGTRKTADASLRDGWLWIDPDDTYYTDDWSAGSVDAYARAVDLASILSAHCDANIDDRSGYLLSRERDDIVRYFAERRAVSDMIGGAGKEYWQAKNADRWIADATAAVNAGQMVQDKPRLP